MQVGPNPHDEVPREGLVRLLPPLLAEGKVVLDRFLESLLQFLHRGSLEGDHVAGINDLAMKDVSVLVKLDNRLIAFVLHNKSSPSGVTPASVRKRLMDISAPLSVSLLRVRSVEDGAHASERDPDS